ncbi:MAG TPA: AraC family transcriptional regulator [Mizugakiibacter sp.]
MTPDRLHALLQRFSVRAGMFHSGPLCGIHDFDDPQGRGQLHLVRQGPVEVRHAGGAPQRIDRPSLIFYPRALPHRFVTDPERGADMACANIQFGAGAADPLARALPSVLVMPLDDVDGAESILELLFAEAFARRCGRQHVVDRLFEVVLILIMRTLMDRGHVDRGVFAGFGHPQLARALVAMHEAPADAWTLERMAARAGMSRSHFATTFAQVVGVPASEYLAGYRIALAQDMLRRGRPIKWVAVEVGYGSAAALSRAFSARCGCSPRAWKASQEAASAAG